MDTNPEMRELLTRLETRSRQQVRCARLQCLFAILAAVSCCAMLFAVLSVVPQVHQIAVQIKDLGSQAETVLTNLESVTSELAEVDLSSMVRNVDALVSDSQEGVKEALDKINSLDIASLNRAISDLSAVVKPLADFFNRFQ